MLSGDNIKPTAVLKTPLWPSTSAIERSWKKLCPGNGDSKQVTVATANEALQPIIFLNTVQEDYIDAKINT